MEIFLEDMGRRFNQEWIFRRMNYQFKAGQSYAVLGPNGSGKSTLLQIVSGSLSPSAGKVLYSEGGKAIEAGNIYQYLSLAAPYLELIEEFTLRELMTLHFRFKRIISGLSMPEMIALLQFESSENKEIRYFSSGMKQRLKLLLACCTDSPVLLLDEPTSNLDNQGISWYLELMDRFAKDRLLIVGSNQYHEYDFCKHRLNIPDYK